MEKILTAREAWADFYEWAKTQQWWKDMERTEKRKLYDAQADFEGQRGQNLGYSRIKKFLNQYAPDRYEFKEQVFLNDE